jgi:hypothetical protein
MIGHSIEQTDALKRIYSGQAGGFFAAVTNFIGEILGIKSVSVSFNRLSVAFLMQ